MRADGYRYVRSYRSAPDRPWDRWALWEIQGGRARRVGTARTEDDKRAFLLGNES
jgi:hypothetical protein